MRRALRWLGIGLGGLLLLAGGAWWYFLYAPSPDPPRLSAAVAYDSIGVGDLARRYAYYVPSGLPAGAPLVLVLHGSMGNAETIRRETAYAFERLADRHGFVVAYPEGYANHWKDCRRAGPSRSPAPGADDLVFLRSLVARFAEDPGIDTTRVFAVGISNGGHMSYRLALEAPDLVRAVAAVAASVPAGDNMQCVPRAGPTPVLIVNGTDDPINPYEGGNVTLFGFGDRGRVLSARRSGEYFARRNGITAEPTTETLGAPRKSGTTSAVKTVWGAGTSGEVRLYTIRGGGHTLPRAGSRSPRLLGRTHAGLDAAAEIWMFFESRGAL